MPRICEFGPVTSFCAHCAGFTTESSAHNDKLGDKGRYSLFLIHNAA